MQKLYEHHKVLTYPRTDSKYISTDIVDTLKDRVKAVSVGDYTRVCTKILKNKINTNKSFVDNSKVTDHHAIIPTEERVFLSDLSDKEIKIYDLVVKRFLSVLSEPFEYEQTSIKAVIEDETFVAKGKKVIKLGWKENYTNVGEDDDNQNLPSLNKGDIIKITKSSMTSGKTQPPKPLNEASLLAQMEKEGLGTVATRADIIEKIFNSFLVEKRGKDIFITSKGKQLLDLVPSELKSAELTASWEKKLNDISSGKLKKDVFVNEMKNYTKDIVKDIKNSDATFRHDNLTRNKCPECGKYMLEVNGKRGKMLVCQDRDCNTRKTVSMTTNARCPVCHKRLELRGEGEAKTFVCNCGHREKLSSFNKRKKEESNKASRKDINKYLKNQNKKEESFNNPFAEALAKLKK